MAKRVSTRRIKKHRLYSYDEAGMSLCITPHTVRSWRSLGLNVMTSSTPHYILGAELIRYIAETQAKRSVKMACDEMYCFKCKGPRKPLWAIVDYVPINDARGRLSGLCETCEGGLQRFVSKDDLGKFGQFFEIAIKNIS